MNKKKGHYYLSCAEEAMNGIRELAETDQWQPLAVHALVILAHLADRLADLVLAVEENTAASMYPDPDDH